MKKLLMIDDSSTFLRVLSSVLKERYTIVGQAQNAEDGLKLFKSLNPDIVLLDITMPNINGKDCLAMIMRENPKAQVIMVSSLADEQSVKDCLRLGARDFVAKELVTMANKSNNDVLFSALSRLDSAELRGA